MKPIIIALVALALWACAQGSLSFQNDNRLTGTSSLVVSWGQPQNNPPGGSHTIGQTTIEGRTYDLIDTTGDGRADWIRDPRSGAFYPLTPQPSSRPASQPTDAPGIPQPPRARSGNGVFYSNPPAQSRAVDFTGGNAQQWRQQLGLTALRTNGQRGALNGVGIAKYDIDANWVDMFLSWSGDLVAPNLWDHPNVQFEVRMLLDSDPQMPPLIVYRLVGDIRDVARLLIAFGIRIGRFATGSSGDFLRLDYSAQRPNELAVSLESGGQIVKQFGSYRL